MIMDKKEEDEEEEEVIMFMVSNNFYDVWTIREPRIRTNSVEERKSSFEAT